MVGRVAVGWRLLRVIRFSPSVSFHQHPMFIFITELLLKGQTVDAWVPSHNANAVSVIGGALERKSTFTFFCRSSKMTSTHELRVTTLADQLCRSCCCNVASDNRLLSFSYSMCLASPLELVCLTHITLQNIHYYCHRTRQFSHRAQLQTSTPWCRALLGAVTSLFSLLPVYFDGVAGSGSGAIASNGRVISEWWIG
jgi:hypothetical protein